MSILSTLLRRMRLFGLRRSVGIYLIIVVGLVLASELVIESIISHAKDDPVLPILNALLIAALAGVFVFFLFHGAVEDREKAAAALGESEARFKSLTSLSADWFWEADADHRLCWIAGGESMLKLFGSELAYGRRVWEIPGIEVPATELERLSAAIAASVAFHELELCRPGAAGTCVEYHLISGEPRRDRQGRFLGYRGVGRDVTATKRAEHALSNAKARLDLALQSGAHAVWDSDLSTQSIYLSEGWTQMLGEPISEQRNEVARLLERVHVQDRDAARLAARRAVKNEAAVFSVEMRVRTATGDWKWVMASGRVVERDLRDRALRMSGTVVDIDPRKRAEQAVRDAEARYRTLVELSPDGVLLQSDGRIEYANRAAMELLGASSTAALLGRSAMEMVHPDFVAAMQERTQYLLMGPGVSEFRECRMLRFDGAPFSAEVAGVSYLERGRLVMQLVLRDITERVRSREELAEREQRFRDVVEAAGEYVWETDAQFRYTWLSSRVESVLGHLHVDLLGRRPQDFMPLGEARATEERLMGHSMRAEPFRDLVHRSITKSGRLIWQSISGVPVFDSLGALKGFRGTGADITARKQAEERIQYLATRDSLTGLPNRLLLSDRAGQAILNAGRKHERIAVLSIHLDRFDQVNDSLGHQVGDALLRAVAERLSNTLRKDDTLGRLDGEKFVLLWDGTREIDDVAVVAQKVVTALNMPVFIEGRALNATASIGIGVFPVDGRQFSDLLKNADAAGFAARESGGNTYRFYSSELNARVTERLELENDLRRALLEGEFELHYQPIVRDRLRSGLNGSMREIVGAEVMLRWRHPVRGMLTPDAFLPIAEQCGLIESLGAWLATSACAQAAAWTHGPASELWLALNDCGGESGRNGSFMRSLEGALKRHGLDGARFVLQITEGNLRRIHDAEEKALRAMVDCGVVLAIGDFGAGQANLTALRRIPVRKLKIDQSLVAEVDTREDSAVIVQTVAAMARGLGLALSAGGVDTAAQLVRLHALGCEEWQGRYFSEPLEAARFEQLLGTENRSAAG